MEASKKLDSITAEQVADYLHSHRDFFMLRDDLLLELNLPHQHQQGTASLVEKQVAVLRERNIEMRNRLATLTKNATVNDGYFHHTRDLVIALLECKNLDAIAQCLKQGFIKNFNLSAFSIVIFADTQAHKNTTARVLPLADAENAISGLIHNRQCVCGILRDNENQFLFKDKANKVASAATIVLGGDKKLGMLALGSDDSKHFSSDMDTLFLSFIADVVSKIIEPILSK